MKNKLLIPSFGLAILGCIFFMSADHIDAPAVKGGTADITDFYAFQGNDTKNMVFVAYVQGLLSPTASSTAKFDENVLIEINIDNNGDLVEDLVIQAISRNGKMYFFGPMAPTSKGLSSTILTTATNKASVDITKYGETQKIGAGSGMTVFAGPRDDPFFFDFGQYSKIIAGTATSFNKPGTDTFAGSNVMSVVVELPKTMLGNSADINCWLETKSK